MKSGRVLLALMTLMAVAAAASAQTPAPPRPVDPEWAWKELPPPAPQPQQPPQPPQQPMKRRSAEMPAPPAEPRHPSPPGLGKWWKDSDIVRALEITPAQVNQLEQTFLDRRLKIIDLRAAVEREELRLQPLIEADEIDEAKVSAQIDAVLAARARLEKENTMMMLALRRILSVEQWKKLQNVQREQEARQRWWLREQQEHEMQGVRPRSPRPPDPDEI